MLCHKIRTLIPFTKSGVNSDITLLDQLLYVLNHNNMDMVLHGWTFNEIYTM